MADTAQCVTSNPTGAEKNDLSVAFSHVVPTATQQANLFASTNEGRQTLDDAGFESTPGPGFRRSPATASSRPQFP